jgi:hypothetical protein
MNLLVLEILVAILFVGGALIAAATAYLAKVIAEHLKWHKDVLKERPWSACKEGSCNVGSQPVDSETERR